MPNENGLAKREAQDIVSEWVSFRVNPRPRNIEGGVKIGTDVVGGEVVHNSRYIGTFYFGRQGVVFPYLYVIEKEIEKLEEKYPDGPWVLPVFVKIARNAYQAYAIDDERLALEKGIIFDRDRKDRLEAVEARVYVLYKMYKRITSSVVSEKIVIAIDYQYFSKSIREEGKNAGLEDLIELICDWGVMKRRNEVIFGKKRIYVFDFFNPQFSDLYEIWKNRGYMPIHYESYKSPPENGVIDNPTDKVIIETSLKEIEELKDEIDAFCLVSGDKHFHNLIRDIREQGKRVIVAAFKRNTSRDIYIAANNFIDLSIHLAS